MSKQEKEPMPDTPGPEYFWRVGFVHPMMTYDLTHRIFGVALMQRDPKWWNKDRSFIWMTEGCAEDEDKVLEAAYSILNRYRHWAWKRDNIAKLSGDYPPKKLEA